VTGHTERSMKGLLEAALLPPKRTASGVLAFGIQSPDYSRVADAIWAPYNRHTGLEGYEIKVFRGDVAAELADPMKCEAWQRYCTRWWLFVADPSLVEGLQVPSQWGIVAPPSGRRTRSLTVLRPAPELRPVDTGQAWQRLHVWYVFRNADQAMAHQREVEALNQVIASRDAELSRLRAAGDPLAREVDSLVTRITQRLSAEGVRHLRDEDLAGCITEAALDAAGTKQHAKNRLIRLRELFEDADELLGGAEGRSKLGQRVKDMLAEIERPA
jgi:hypothetical protein